jgi:carbon monoxide dehydrogenase subunit G
VHYEGKFDARVGSDRLYALMTNPSIVVTLIPDVVSFKVADMDHFSVKARAGIGPMRGIIDMDFALDEKKDGRFVKLRGKGRGMQSNVDLVLSMTIEGGPGNCTASWVADAQVGGMLAGVGGRLIDGITESYVRRMTDELRKKVAE